MMRWTVQDKWNYYLKSLSIEDFNGLKQLLTAERGSVCRSTVF